jgi:cytochrome c peroxidase
MRRARWLAIAALAAACGGPVAMPDASVPDASTSDAGPDAYVCTLSPGDLPGDREIAAGGLLPDMTFATETGSIALSGHHVPCADRAELLVLRSLAAWSGLSGWQIAHTARLLAHPERDRVHFIDLLVQGVDALPARAVDLAPFAARYDVMPDALALDPEERFGALALAGIAMPVVVLVDARDLHVVRVLFGPHAGVIEHEITRALRQLDGEPPPPPFEETLVDGRFTEDEWTMIGEMAFPATLPPDPSNAHADDPLALSLGDGLFEDGGLSPTGVACRSCHQIANGFTDALAVGHGVADVTRNTPTVLGAGLVRWPFWDGRVDSVWAQALGPIESAREMGSSRLYVAHRIADFHGAEYEAVFGALPDLADVARFPAAGQPGDAAWDAMSAADQETVNRIFSNAGKAIEAYERSLSPPPTAFDAYVAGDASALSELERDGLREFFRDGCAECHFGPLLSNGAFHAIDMPGFGTGASLDVGRIAAFDVLAASPFRRQGVFSDAAIVDPLAGLTALPESTRGAFRTPTLRSLSSTAPYGHAGTFTALRDVVLHYARIRTPHDVDPHVAGTLDAHLLGFDDVADRVDPLTAFLEAL